MGSISLAKFFSPVDLCEDHTGTGIDGYAFHAIDPSPLFFQLLAK
jgi:hypothetical protein